jgi:hypothetical protein
MYSKSFYSQNKEKYKKYYQDNKSKIIEYLKTKREKAQIKKVEDVVLTYKDRYIINKLYDFVKQKKDKCFLQKKNIQYFNENKQIFIDYYHMIKNNNKHINHYNELLILGENNFNIQFCYNKCYEKTQFKIIEGKFTISFD